MNEPPLAARAARDSGGGGWGQDRGPGEGCPVRGHHRGARGKLDPLQRHRRGRGQPRGGAGQGHAPQHRRGQLRRSYIQIQRYLLSIYISTSKYICRSTTVSRYIYQLLGKNVTEEYYKVTPRLNHAMEEAVKVAERKEKNNEVIIISAV